MSDKPLAVQDNKLFSKKGIRTRHRARALSLYAVDDSIRGIVRALKRTDQWDDTVLLFTSDNGFQLGEHRFIEKDLPYQQSLRVPLMVRGPGVPRAVVPTIATTVDVPVTLAALAGVRPGRVVDGTNALTAPDDRAVLIQSGNNDAQWDWRGVYTSRWTFAEHTTGEVELYDRQRDPSELENVADDPSLRETRNQLERLYADLRGCAGDSCVTTLP